MLTKTPNVVEVLAPRIVVIVVVIVRELAMHAHAQSRRAASARGSKRAEAVHI